ncbi:MAG TPA: hypothetical protein VGW38_24340, partial [Chloroflexota bacterium]|nr:hypothetical protein [Chloroflexota bacterium]
QSDDVPLRVWRNNPGGPAGGAAPGAPSPTGEAAGTWTTPEVQFPPNRLTGTANAFIDLLVNGGPSPADARTGRTAVEMVLAGYQSSREGREVLLRTT